MAVPGIMLLLNDSIHCSVRSAGHLGSGVVTLKNASRALVSNAPGVSMDADVVARMKGGVSSRMGGGPAGMVTIFFSLMKPRRPLNVSRKDCIRWSGAGCFF